jgi:hypothetical protein
MSEQPTQALAMREESRALALQPPDLSAIERVIVAGDLSKLSPDERWAYYQGVCRTMGLNPFTTPFAYLTLQGKMVLYANKGCAEQLRGIHHLSISKPQVDVSDGLCIVSVTAHHPSGREDSDLGIVPIEGLKGEAKANAVMKAITKAKRRVTLSMLGLGMLDESEVETIPGAKVEAVEIPRGALPSPTEEAVALNGIAQRLGENPGNFTPPPGQPAPVVVPPPIRSNPSTAKADNIERVSDPADTRWQWFERLRAAATEHSIRVPNLPFPVPVPALLAASRSLEQAIEKAGGALPDQIDAPLPPDFVDEAEWRETTSNEAEQPALD